MIFGRGVTLTSPGYSPQNDEKKGIFIHQNGGAFGSDLTEESVRRMAMGKDSDKLTSGLGGLLGGVVKLVGGVIQGIADAVGSIFGGGGPQFEGDLTGTAKAAFEALKPMMDEVLAAKEFVEEASKKAEQEHQETLAALRVAVAEVEKMRIDSAERRKLAQVVARSATEPGKLGAGLAEALRLLSLANSRGLDQNERVDAAQQDILRELAETDQEIIQVQQAQQRNNEAVQNLVDAMARTRIRLLLTGQSRPEGLTGYLHPPRFGDRTVSLTATGRWDGTVAVLLRASNGAVDFNSFRVLNGKGQLGARPGGGPLLRLEYDAVLCLVLPD